jgi:hypothetical protein
MFFLNKRDPSSCMCLVYFGMNKKIKSYLGRKIKLKNQLSCRDKSQQEKKKNEINMFVGL